MLLLVGTSSTAAVLVVVAEPPTKPFLSECQRLHLSSIEMEAIDCAWSLDIIRATHWGRPLPPNLTNGGTKVKTYFDNISTWLLKTFVHLYYFYFTFIIIRIHKIIKTFQPVNLLPSWITWLFPGVSALPAMMVSCSLITRFGVHEPNGQTRLEMRARNRYDIIVENRSAFCPIRR